MSSYDPVIVAFQHVRARCGPDLDGRVTAVSEHPAPHGTNWPVLTYQFQASDDSLGLGTIRYLTEVELLVRVAFREGTSLDVAGTVEAIDQALVSQQCFDYERGRILGCVRVRPFHLTETGDDSRPVRHRGGIYRLTVS